MSQAPDQTTRSQAWRPPSSVADQLYPPQGTPDNGVVQSGENSAANPGESMSRSDMANRMYPNDVQREDREQPEEDTEDSEGGEQDEEGLTAQGENGAAAQTAASRMHAVLRTFGVDASGGQGRKEADGAAKLEAGMREAVADAEEGKGAPLTPDEEQNIAGEYIANHAMKWLRLRKHDPDKMTKILWDEAGGIATGGCAKTFRKAFERAGGDSTGHPVPAKDWGPTLERNGYEKLDMATYLPQNGDVRVISGVPPRDPQHPTSAELYGHIQVYDAVHKQWVSERKDPGDGIVSTFKNGHATIAAYRFNPF